MSIRLHLFATCLIAAGLLVPAARGGKPTEPQSNERAVFVTGSLIPQRIKLKQIGTTTTSPIRIIDRQEINATGRRTTRGVLVADPSVRVIGH